jgi:citrate lyase subunit beta / citryl-CoA lyase
MKHFASRAHRTMLYVPADRDRMLQKCLALEPDSFIFDLEDAVAAEDKQEARTRLASFLSENQIAADIGTWIRINNVNSTPDVEDLRVAVRANLSGVIVPMATPSTLKTSEEMIAAAEGESGVSQGSIKIIALVETPLGIETLDQIIKSSSRVVAVQFGAEDFTLAMGVARSSDGVEILYARQRIAVACHAYGVDAIDTPYTDYRDPEGLTRDTELVKSLGFAGKTLIHPDQISPVRMVFSPSEKEVDWATRVIEMYQKNGGEGSFALDGAMVDRPVIMRAKSILETAGRDTTGA